MEKILIVEDELIVARDIRKTMEKAGHKIAGVVRTFEKAVAAIQDIRPTLVLVDIFLKGSLTGIDLANRLNIEGIPFIYISANSNQPVLEAAKTTNPFGFVVKPFREKDLLVAVDIARYRYENHREINAAHSPEDPAGPAASPAPTGSHADPGARSRTPHHAASFACDGIIGKTAPMLHVFHRVQQVAPFDTSVMLLGESGTGKEGIASCIVRQSRRRLQPFIKINCAAIPAELIESELFGHEKGAFTGAYEKKTGKFEQAAGGTLLLDEIGEMPVDMQAKLLRVLQEKEIQRIGSNTIIKTDTRIIAATSKNLEKEIAGGRFRLDLYYRLLAFPITLPALRERKEDIPMLVRHFIHHYSAATGKTVKSIDPRVLESLIAYSWPGNVRELQHLIERSVLLANDDTIREVVLPEEPATPDPHAARRSAPGSVTTLKTLEEIEKAHIVHVLEHCHFKVSGPGGAAELLNLSSPNLFAKMKKLGITRSHSS